MRVKLDAGAFPPTRGHATDAGLDIRAMNGAVIGPGASETFRTGVHVELPEGTCGLLVSRSGLNTKYDITSTGLIDQPYRGEILVRLHNHGKKYYEVRPGDKISQLVVIPVLYEPVELADELSESDRGSDGFGSTGR